MSHKFKVGDILRTDNGYTTVLLVKTYFSKIWSNRCFGEAIPMFNRFPLGPALYSLGLIEDWNIIPFTEELQKEARRVLDIELEYKAIDNLTYIELLNILNERIEL